jgi:hypothetical protein
MSNVASGDWTYLSAEELAAQSDFILVGEFLGRDNVRLAADGSPLNIGVIRADTVLKGSAGAAYALVLLPPARAGGLVASTDIRLEKGQRGLWYLKKTNEGLYVIDRPDRFLPMAAAAARIHALSNK